MDKPEYSSGISADCKECRDIFGRDYQSGRGFERIKFIAAIKNQDVLDEGGFSWNECDICGSTLGGDRFVAHDGAGNHYNICVDCLFNQ